MRVVNFGIGVLCSILAFCCGHDRKHHIRFETHAWGLQYIDHYTTLGFDPVGGSVEHQVANSCQFVHNKDTVILPGAKEGFRILHLSTKCGAELWGGATEFNEFFGNDPHYSGPSRMRVFLHEKIMNEFNEGGFACDGGIDCCEDGCLTDLEFFCPTFQLCGTEVEIPRRMTVQLCAFARECQVFDSLEKYNHWRKSQREKGRIGFPDQCFTMEKALFGDDEKNNYYALFSGRVVQAERKVNDRTGEPFFWALIETLGNQQIDVVVHPMVVRGNPPRPGSVILGSFFLSGRLLPDEE